MKKLFTLITIVLLMYVSGYGQYPMGCLLLPEAQYKSITLEPPVHRRDLLPTLFILPTPAIGYQDGGSCTAWGTTYAARSIDWYMTHGNTSYSYSTNIFSPEYVYNQINFGCSGGAYVTSALNILKTQGVCRYVTMPPVSGCSIQPNATQKAEAVNYKIINYNRVTIAVTTIKNLIAEGNPVIVAGPVNSAFHYLGNNQILGAYSGTTLGGHCYCVVGYDDSKGAFKFQNSWGSGWASGGFGWIGYAYITSWWSEAYVITNSIPPPPPIPELLTVTPEHKHAGNRAGTRTFTITANGAWVAGTDVSWCRVTESGMGNGKLVATYEANTGIKRVANITVTRGKTFKEVEITQRKK